MFIANSRNVARRIRRRYGRESVVIPPPVDASRFTPRPLSEVGNYYLAASALVPYKRIDLAVEAFRRLKLPLKIAGDGPEAASLRRLAHGASNIEFVGWASDGDLSRLYEGARALIFPGEEDAGITPMESQAAGRPVIAFGKGGALETVTGLSEDGKNAAEATGIFFGEQTPDALADAVLRFEANFDRFSPDAARTQALKFDKSAFKSAVWAEVERTLQAAAREGAGCCQLEGKQP